MTSSLRPLRIRVVDPTQVGALLGYLRERGCIAEQVDAVAVDVWPPELLHERACDGPPLGAGSVPCAACGEPVEDVLRRLGSPRCHDCRAASPAGAPLTPAVNGDARRRGRRALHELQAHLRAWRLAEGAAAAVLEDA